MNSPAFWIGFNVFVLAMLILDLGVFHRKAHSVSIRESAGWVCVWVTLALIFGVGVGFYHERHWQAATEFFTGYVLEQSLSMDNVFVIALIFASFRIPVKFQHRVLFYGILGVLLMRGSMILVGAALIKQAHWVLYLFGGFLIFTGIKMAMSGEDDEAFETKDHWVVRQTQRFLPVHPSLVDQDFFVRIGGKLMATPLFIVLVIVETTDLVFAVDSIPAIFGVTTDSFIVYTSNVFAVLGLRSLYFMLAGMMGLFRYLKLGLSIVLVFVGVKMLELHHINHFNETIGLTKNLEQVVSLSIILGILAVSVIASLIAARQDGTLSRAYDRIVEDEVPEEPNGHASEAAAEAPGLAVPPAEPPPPAS